MSRNRSIGSEEYMKKRIPKNVKYDHVRTRLDTGCSSTKYVEKLEELRKNYRYRKDEIFKRLKVTTFAQLVLQVALSSVRNHSEADDVSHIPQDSLSMVSDEGQECPSEYTTDSALMVPPLSQCQDSGDSKDICHSARSKLLNVISGVGELNIDEVIQHKASELVSSPAPVNVPYPDCPYLLLDMRDHEQYDRCHIISAQSFPVARLSRTMNPYSKEMLEYKNAQGKIIVVYDEDEMIASQAATVMCQRGFENLFLLSGGLKVIAQKFPCGMTTGSFPVSCLSSPSSKGRKCSVLQQPAERRCRFTFSELANIQEQLEETLIPNKSNSCMSSCSTTSSTCSAASSRLSLSSSIRNSSRVHSSRPWK
ncbi:centrosomal protein of 41 kDa [Austrofundulus limnaeus]|uniref:Centrosomal protein of 41 kDa n=1 Tax=Austrofundulus limnaeus TaxID=52670 RepID=A0A2I4DAI0_AUSLI|nr:PREDICTED: centrosomal protein of 41 kDa [Austrofundulus limnaeus]